MLGKTCRLPIAGTANLNRMGHWPNPFYCKVGCFKIEALQTVEVI